ncbi:MAG: hypothetical protein ABUL66_02705, partial [Verrucomicrobiota bacterium]
MVRRILTPALPMNRNDDLLIGLLPMSKIIEPIRRSAFRFMWRWDAATLQTRPNILKSGVHPIA